MPRRRLRMAHAVLRPARVPEKSEQAHIIQLLRSVGGKVYVSGTTRRRGDHQGTMQTPGIPDLEVFLPRRDVPGKRLQLKVECKAVGGRLSPEQQEYKQLCAEADVAHVHGTLDAVIAWLVDRGYIKADSVPHYRRPAPEAQS
jgi:hypothetical protein